MLPELYTIPGFEPGKLSIMGRPRSDDWLEDEIKGLSFAGVEVLVSLLTSAEVRELGLEKEADFCNRFGLIFLELPIADRAVPQTLAALQALVKQLLELIAIGKHAVIHCRMGIGRSALVSAVLLVKKGFTVEQALDIIGQARGCEVPDTEEQKIWLKLYNY